MGRCEQCNSWVPRRYRFKLDTVAIHLLNRDCIKIHFRKRLLELKGPIPPTFGNSFYHVENRLRADLDNLPLFGYLFKLVSSSRSCIYRCSIKLVTVPVYLYHRRLESSALNRSKPTLGTTRKGIMKPKFNQFCPKIAKFRHFFRLQKRVKG